VARLDRRAWIALQSGIWRSDISALTSGRLRKGGGAPMEKEDIDSIDLLGFRVDPATQGADFYTLMVFAEKTHAITLEGQIVFFASPVLAPAAYQLFSDDIKRIAPVPTEAVMIFDLPGTLHLVRHERQDDTATILNSLNTLLDLVYASELTIPEAYRRTLFKFADHLTFSKEYGSYLSEHSIDRADIVNAIFWCVGAVVGSSTLLSPQDLESCNDIERCSG
jgi:hypothetical protein